MTIPVMLSTPNRWFGCPRPHSHDPSAPWLSRSTQRCDCAFTIAPSCVWLKAGAEVQGPSTKQPVHFAVEPAYDQQSGPVTAAFLSGDIAAVATLNVPSGWSSIDQRDACLPAVAHVASTASKAIQQCAICERNSVQPMKASIKDIWCMRTVGHAYGCSDLWRRRGGRWRQV